METRHIRIDYEEALSSKKQLLSSELNLLQTLKYLKGYKILRKKEMTEKNNLRAGISSLKAKISLIQSTFPKEESNSKLNKIGHRIKQFKTTEKTQIGRELEEIQERLARLNQIK
jgi:hypothetical protein